jgi:hypothetical protein
MQAGLRPFALAALALCACATPPEVEGPPTGFPDAGAPSRFADTVIVFTFEGRLVSCVGTPPPAGCASHPALGPNDGRAVPLRVGDRLEVAFLYGLIFERSVGPGAATPDLKVWSMVPAGSQAVVEVSFDGSFYRALGVLTMSDQTFELERIAWREARFVRIVQQSGDPIAIDALEAL